METKYFTKKMESDLVRKFKTNQRIAEKLGITYRRYCQIRATRRLTKTLSLLISYLLEGTK